MTEEPEERSPEEKAKYGERVETPDRECPVCENGYDVRIRSERFMPGLVGGEGEIEEIHEKDGVSFIHK